VGNVYIRIQLGNGESKEFVVHRVLYVPNLACNLFSVRAAASKGNLLMTNAGYTIELVMFVAWAH